MKGKLFIDTNILIYLFSNSEIDKRNRIKQFFVEHHENQIVWSTQVMQELYVTLTKKFKKDPILVKQVLNEFNHFELFVNNSETIKLGIDISVVNKLSFWDSLIISSASLSKCNYVISEDLNHEQSVNGVEIYNPLL